MSLTFTIATSLSFAFGKFLLKKYLNDDGVGTAFEALTDIAKPKIKDFLDQKKAARAVEELADKIVAQIQELLEEERRQQPDLNVEGIAEQLLATLQTDLSAEFFVKGDLVPQRVADNYAALRPLPRGVLDPRSGEAYGRMLDHAAMCLVALANQLPDFQTQAVASSLQRLRGLEETADKTFAQMRRMVTAVERLAAPGDPQKFEIEYRQAVAANLDYIELFGITIPRELRRFQLTDAFVSLNLQRSLTPTNNLARRKKRNPESPDTDEDRSDSELLSCEAVLERLRPGEGRLLIRGAAGSGKTTLMRWVAIQAASVGLPRFRHDFSRGGFSDVPGAVVQERQQLGKGGVDGRDLNPLVKGRLDEAAEDGALMAINIDTQSWREQVPFVVLLRHCPDGKLPLAEEFHKLIGEGVGSPPPDWVRTVLKDGRGLVLIDGVDEVPPDHREEVVRGLDLLTKFYPKSYFVVTTRPEAVPDGWLAHLKFREAHINPMGPLDVEQFIRRWHDIAGRNLTVAGKPGDLSDKRQRLLDQLDENDALRPLSTYPLLCGSICALHLDRSGTLPETQSALCEAMCDSLLHHREREQQELKLEPFPAAYHELSVDQKRTLIQDLAVYMVEEGRSALTQSQARERLGKQLAGFKDRSAGESEVVLKGLLERSGILREPVPEEVDFLHNTFKEYLAGEHFAGEQSTNKLLEHVFAGTESAESWRRVTLFAAGSRRAPKGFVRELIQALLKPPSALGSVVRKLRRSRFNIVTDPQRLRHLLALQCQIVADGRGLPPELKNQLAALVEELFPPRTLSDAESLATLRDQAVPYLKRPKNRKQSQQAAIHCVRALRLINTSTARNALEDYYDTEEDSVLVELAQAVNPLLLPPVVEWVQDNKKFQSLPWGIRERITDLSPLEHRTDIQELHLWEISVSDVSALKGLTALRTLNLYGTPVSDVSALKGLTALKSLDLRGTQVSDVSALRGLTALTVLSLNGTQVSDVSALRGLTALTMLDLNGTQVSDVTALRGLTALMELSLSRTPVSNVSALKELTALRVLSLNGTPVGDVSALKGLTALMRLSLSGMPVSDVSALKGLTALRELDLSYTPVSDISALKGLTALNELNLEATWVSDVSALEGIPRLSILRSRPRSG